MAGISLFFDLRSSPTGASHADLTAAVLDIAEWADRVDGIPMSVRVLEHHGSSDGYNPSPIPLAAAIAGRTRRLRISAVVLVPLYHPLRLAEDLAILDLVSRGRVSCIFAAGYRAEEFAMYGVELAKRGRAVEEAVATCKQAWTGEPFEFRGRQVQVMPRPFQRPHPPIILGGSSEAAAKRAARIADGFEPTIPSLMQVYRDELRALGKDPGPEVKQAGVGATTIETLVAVSEDPDSTWEEVKEHCLHELNSYAAWLGITSSDIPGFWVETNADVLRERGRYLVLTPDELVARAKASGGAFTIEPLLGGIAPKIARQTVELIESKVIPQLR